MILNTKETKLLIKILEFYLNQKYLSDENAIRFCENLVNMLNQNLVINYEEKIDTLETECAKVRQCVLKSRNYLKCYLDNLHWTSNVDMDELKSLINELESHI